MLPYGRQTIDDDDIAAVVEVLKSSWLTTGPAVEHFEAALTAVVGAPCVAVNSGTAALHAAYAALGLGPGRSLVSTPLTFAATATTALHLGASVTFADVLDGTLTLDPAAAAAAVDSRDDVAAIAAVDYAGHPCDLDELLCITRREGLSLVEDAAHALGGTYRGRPIGSIADVTTFSFHPVKTITTAEGGAVAVRDGGVGLDAVRQFRNHGLVRAADRMRRQDEGPWHQEVAALGLNYRMPDVLAALGAAQLGRLRTFVARRAALVARYRTLLGEVPGIRLLDVRDDVDPAWHLFVVRVLDGRRRELYTKLRDAGIGTQVHYLPVHLQPIFEDLGHRRGSCPVAEAAYEEILSLPLFPTLSDAQLDRVVETIAQILGT